MSFRDKLLALDQVPKWRTALREQGKRLVVTNGCFDILHMGHVTYLESARACGDALLVGLTNDAEVRRLKGPGRPINTDQDRAAILAALESVSGVTIFGETDARNFLSVAQPDIYVKGGDYTLDTINQDERHFLENRGVKIVILPGVAGKSTTGLLERIMKL